VIVLGIDTSTDILDLAISNNDKIIVNYRMYKKKVTHSAIIIPVLQDALKTAGLNLKELEGISICIGPGSFTGLRIGLATAKGLSFSLSLPIVGINSFESYAFNWRSMLSGIFCPIIEARKDEYYYTLYQNNNSLIRIKPFQCRKWSLIKKELVLLKKQVYVFGSGLNEIIKGKEDDVCLENVHFLNKEQDSPGAVNIALIGERMLSNYEDHDLLTLSPFYIRKSAAEIKKDKAENNNRGINDH